MSYRSYLDSFLLPFEEGRSADVQRRNTQIKARRHGLKNTFTDPGQPGAMFRSSISPSSTFHVEAQCGMHIIHHLTCLLDVCCKSSRVFNVLTTLERIYALATT